MELKAGYKNTEIGVIPEEWEITKIGDLADIATGSTPPTNDRTNYGTDFLFVSPADLGEIKWIENSEKKLSEKGFSISRKFPKNSILFTCIGSTIGKSGIAKIDLTSNQQINAVFPNESYNTEFAYYELQIIAKEIKAQAGEQAVPMVNKTSFAEFKIPLPPLPEQTAIATVLSDTDSLIQALEKKIAKKQLIKKGAMQVLLSPMATTQIDNGQLTNDNSQLSTVNCQLKKGWVVKTLGEIFEITAGGDLRSNEFSEVETSEFPFSIFSNAQTNLGLYGFCKTYDYEGNALTISARGGIGYTVSRFNKFAAIGRLLVLKPSDDINCKFIEEFININIEFSSESTGVPQLTAPQVSKYKVSFPPKQEQTRIAQILSDMDSEIETLKKKLAKYKELKQGLMQVLLTGKIRLI